MSILVVVFLAILMVFQGLPVHSRYSPIKHFMKLNDAVSNKIKRTMEELADSSIPEAQASYRSLQEAVELPLLQLDEKILAFDKYRKGYGARKNPELEANADEESKEFMADLRSSSFERKVIKVLEKVGLYESFADRVWSAILCDPKRLKKLKQALANLSSSSSSVTYCDEHKGKHSDCKKLLDLISSLFK